MTAIRTAETRVITITVSDLPDLANWDGKFHITPATVELTYRWWHPDHRPEWFKPGRAAAKVTGPRRLKSGAVGQQECTFEFHADYGREHPNWLRDLIAAHAPEGWDQ
ncbi:hypothetical protein P3T35_003145 [Kitasatospora sp. GP30]|uniref:hypothetical protein n=1 Tax=Kitasatospora sp. GP30 TaxID=3035084 RepID=UPI000C7108FD|nr:hypothetical protein [Kitasatospora sp. GP30]MDH6141132.1 hypothetical protein [Kitasatospora sp. GP30]